MLGFHENGKKHVRGDFKKKLRWWLTNPPEETLKLKITPAMAEMMLEYNDRNRPVSEITVRSYAEDMAADRWEYTRVPIIFSDERLIDGQHRLEACALSGSVFVADVAFGAPDSAFSYIDIGKKRGASDILAINGVPNYCAVSTAVSQVHEYDLKSGKAFQSGSRVKTHEIMDLYERYEDVQRSVWAYDLSAKHKMPYPTAWMALHYICARKSRTVADDFFRATIEGFGFDSKKDPAYLLHKRLIRTAFAEEKITKKAMAGLILTAWNARRAERQMQQLRYNAEDPLPRAA